MQGGVKFISAWQRFLVRSLSSVVALAVARRSTFTVSLPSFWLVLYTQNACLSIGEVHKLWVHILWIVYTCNVCIIVV